MTYEEESSESGHAEPWIQWFCGLEGNNFFCEVERSYIEDGFNLYGLRASVSNFSDCLDLILDLVNPDDSDDSHLSHSACTLYGLIHARYVVTTHGLDAMYNKYIAKEFGICPLIQCNGQPVLPVGVTDEMGVDAVKIFCPKCLCVYHPAPMKSRGSDKFTLNNIGSGIVDGAAFGTTFPHLFLMTFGNLTPDKLPEETKYIPRVFGFRVHKITKPMVKNQTSESIQNNSAYSGKSTLENLTLIKSRSQTVDKSWESRKGVNGKFNNRENGIKTLKERKGYNNLCLKNSERGEEKLSSKKFSWASKLRFNEFPSQKNTDSVKKNKKSEYSNENKFDQKVTIGTSKYRDVNENLLPVKPKKQKRSSSEVT